jgi:GMP synthase (glutamine-hydrolysing)
LYKVEVRELGARLGIPDYALNRHPFPGPGLGVRLLCSDGVGDPPALTEALARISDEFNIHTAVLPIRSVGVKADLRVYEHPVMITGQVSFDKLGEATRRILSEVPDVNRSIWNLAAKAPQKLRSLAATTTRARLDLLREADHLVMEALHRHDLYHSIWQCPTAMVPLEIDGLGRELVIIRPVHSERAMTATPSELPAEVLAELSQAIMALDGVSGVALDLTSKPPGTIEWE